MLLRQAPEHAELRSGLRRLFDTAAGPAEVHRLLEKDAAFDPALVTRLADELGVFGLAVPERFGGAGYGLVELGVVFAEAGRAIVCAPLLSASLFSQLLLASGNEAACATYLPGLCTATTWGTVAVVEGDGDWTTPPTTRAVPVGGAVGSSDGWTLTGVKDWVLDAASADVLIVSAITDEGVALFAVDVTSAGVRVEPVACVDLSRRVGRVDLDGAPATLVVSGAAAQAAINRTSDVALVLLAAEQTGVTEYCLQAAVGWAKTREQFGRAIGSFQAIKHKLADVQLALEAAVSASMYALAVADTDPGMLPSAARVAAVTCGQAAVRAAQENIQVHGGIGATWEHPAHLYLRRALTDRLLVSDEQTQLEDLAAAVASTSPPPALGRYGAEIEAFRAEVQTTLDAALPAGWAGLGTVRTEAETAEFLRRWRHTLHAHGLLCVTWPIRFGGRGLSKLHHVVLVEELARRGVPYGRQPQDSTGLKMIGNTLLAWGTEEQQSYYLPRLLSDDTRFCQGFSEPQAGSDLASVRTRARLVDDEWRIDGQKIWTSGALDCTDIFVLARTDPDAPKHRGLSLLLVPLDQPGVEVRPIRHMTGAGEFCEVFFTDARTAAAEVVGPVHEGWRVARSLLALERGDEAATNPVLFRAEFDRMVALARSVGKLDDPVLRQRIARCFAAVEVMRSLGARILADVLDGRDVSAAASVAKLYWSEYHQQLTSLALDVEGRAGLVPRGKGPARMMRTDEPGADPLSTNSWWQVLLNSRTGTIYAGTSEVQRTILAEQLLGLPREA